MEIIIFGGFLGSGKTTLIQSILHAMVEAGHTAAIIENEIGEIGIDQALLQRAEVSVTPLFGGCVCCQITGSLIAAIRDIRARIQPDYLIVEMTGLAHMSGIRQQLKQYGEADVPLHTVAVVDGARFLKLCRVMGELMSGQLGGADAVLLNKTDLAPATQEILDMVASFTTAPMLPVSGRDEDAATLWARLQDAWEGMA
jgi:G3E family GTPase